MCHAHNVRLQQSHNVVFSESQRDEAHASQLRPCRSAPLGKEAGVMNEGRSGVEYLAGHDVDDGDCMFGSYDQTSSVSSQAYADAV